MFITLIHRDCPSLKQQQYNAIGSVKVKKKYAKGEPFGTVQK